MLPSATTARRHAFRVPRTRASRSPQPWIHLIVPYPGLSSVAPTACHNTNADAAVPSALTGPPLPARDDAELARARGLRARVRTGPRPPPSATPARPARAATPRQRASDPAAPAVAALRGVDGGVRCVPRASRPRRRAHARAQATSSSSTSSVSARSSSAPQRPRTTSSTRAVSTDRRLRAARPDPPQAGYTPTAPQRPWPASCAPPLHSALHRTAERAQCRLGRRIGLRARAARAAVPRPAQDVHPAHRARPGARAGDRARAGREHAGAAGAAACGSGRVRPAPPRVRCALLSALGADGADRRAARRVR
jgi:hypothetical protein